MTWRPVIILVIRIDGIKLRYMNPEMSSFRPCQALGDGAGAMCWSDIIGIEVTQQTFK